MNWKKFEYFLNAVHYCIWRADIKMSTIIDRVLDVLFYPIIILLPHKMRQSHTEYLETTKKETMALLHGKTRGWYNGWANHWFGLVYSSYPVVFIVYSDSFYFSNIWQSEYSLVDCFWNPYCIRLYSGI